MNFLDPLLQSAFGPLLMFALRLTDVSLATFRTMLQMRHARMWVPVVAFIEISVWIVAIGSVVKNLSSPWLVLGYALGFTGGTVVGMWIESYVAYGLSTIHIITRSHGAAVAKALHDAGFGATEFTGRGLEGPVSMVLAAVRRREVSAVMAIALQVDSESVVTVEDVEHMRRGWLMHPRMR